MHKQISQSPDLIRLAIKRNVEVDCYVDAYLNQSNGKINSPHKVKLMLEETGASVKVAEIFHNKTLCIYNFLICEGHLTGFQRNKKKPINTITKAAVIDGIPAKPLFLECF